MHEKCSPIVKFRNVYLWSAAEREEFEEGQTSLDVGVTTVHLWKYTEKPRESRSTQSNHVGFTQIQWMLDNPTPNKPTFHNPTGFNG